MPDPSLGLSQLEPQAESTPGGEGQPEGEPQGEKTFEDYLFASPEFIPAGQEAQGGGELPTVQRAQEEQGAEESEGASGMSEKILAELDELKKSMVGRQEEQGTAPSPDPFAYTPQSVRLDPISLGESPHLRDALSPDAVRELETLLTKATQRGVEIGQQVHSGYQQHIRSQLPMEIGRSIELQFGYMQAAQEFRANNNHLYTLGIESPEQLQQRIAVIRNATNEFLTNDPSLQGVQGFRTALTKAGKMVEDALGIKPAKAGVQRVQKTPSREFGGHEGNRGGNEPKVTAAKREEQSFVQYMDRRGGNLI